MKELFYCITILAVFFSCKSDDEQQPSFDEIINGPVVEVVDYSAQMSDFEHDVLVEINKFRADTNNCGGDIMNPTEPLMWHPNLDAAAEAHANDMFDTSTLSHDGSDGSSLSDRLDRADYAASYYGENVAKGPPTAESVVEAFKGSPAHCRVMSSPNFKQVGIAKVGDYWVFDFGTL